MGAVRRSLVRNTVFNNDNHFDLPIRMVAPPTLETGDPHDTLDWLEEHSRPTQQNDPNACLSRVNILDMLVLATSSGCRCVLKILLDTHSRNRKKIPQDRLTLFSGKSPHSTWFGTVKQEDLGCDFTTRIPCYAPAKWPLSPSL